MFTSTIDPVLVSIGPIEIRWYGLVYALGFLLAIHMFKKWAREGRLKLTEEQCYDLAFWLAVGSVVGGRLGEIIFWEPAYYLANPLKIFAFWQGGMAYHGGLIGAIVAVWWYCRKHDLPVLRVGDMVAPWACFVLGIGRVANFTNAEIYGPVTSLPWCVNFPGVEGCRHPYQIYSAIKRFLIGAFVMKLATRTHKPKDGYVFWNAVFLMNLGRFFLDFVRDDSVYLYAGISIGQWISLVIAAASGYLLWTRYRSDIHWMKPHVQMKFHR